MYTALYRAYRPETFDEVLGQKHILQILDNQICRNQVNHAYLFSGTRGTGKTTIARLLAKGVNCMEQGKRPCGQCNHCLEIQRGTFMDLVEIDAASNNGVDHIRELRESVHYPPSIGKKKVYIIDEVHMLSSGAFNALLKTLEEPPDHVMFILATTEPEKLPATILSRCMRMDFRRISEREMMERMSRICENRKLMVEREALEFIAGKADGSVRDGLTILDQCIAGKTEKVTRESVLETLGAIGVDEYLQLTDAVSSHQVERGLELVHQFIEKGKDSRQILMGWMEHYRNLLLVKYMENPEHILILSSENIGRLKEQSQTLSLDAINTGIMEVAQGVEMLRTSSMPRVLLEMILVKLSTRGQKNPAKEENREDRRLVSQKPRETELLDETKKEISVAKAEKTKENLGVNKTLDKEAFWKEFLRQGQKELGGMFAIVENGSSPQEINEEELIIQATGMAQLFIEKNRLKLETMGEKILGHSIRITIGKESTDEKKKNMEQTAEKAESLLGIPIEVE